MNLHKTKIDWCSHTWNPVTGCLHGCDYCYARKTALRFGLHPCEKPCKPPLEVLPKGSGLYYVEEPTKLYDEKGEYIRSTPYPAGFAPTYHAYTMDYPEKREIPSTVFVSSMGDLFGEWVPDVWIEDVFNACKRAPWHTYLFLTKNPQRYIELARAGKLPEAPQFKNFWYGTTITKPDMPFFFCEETNIFLSIEPLLAPFRREDYIDALDDVGWIIIGAMTGGRKNQLPKREWVEEIVAVAREAGIPIFMKRNLAPVWGDDLIQEFPTGMSVPQEGKTPLPRCRECEYATAKPQGKRGTGYDCEIGWEAAGYDDRGTRHIPAHQARTSPPWCPRREGGKM